MIIFVINLLTIFLLFFIIINFNKPKSEFFTSNDVINDYYKKLQPYYNKIKIDLFNNLPKDVSGLQFGYICPGAVKTIEYLNETVRTNRDIQAKEEIIRLTDLQFFIEIIVIYTDYITNKDSLNKVSQILKNQGCNISKKITEKITNLFSSLSKDLKENLPDDFYHIRHNTLICSSDPNLAKERIRLLKSIYNNKENFYNYNNSSCLGKRNGVSGCRDCCSKFDNTNYSKCVSSCMDY